MTSFSPSIEHLFSFSHKQSALALYESLLGPLPGVRGGIDPAHLRAAVMGDSRFETWGMLTEGGRGEARTSFLPLYCDS